METNRIQIPILDWGNVWTMSGIVFSHPDGASVILNLPQKETLVIIENYKPNNEQFLAIMNQLDTLNVEKKLDNNEKMLVSKGRRVLDQNIVWRVFRRDKFKCRYCGIRNVKLTVDHLVLWEEGGTSKEDNLFTCCPKCNRKRGNTPYNVWIQTSYVKGKHQFLTNAEIQANEWKASNLSKEREVFIRSR